MTESVFASLKDTREMQITLSFHEVLQALLEFHLSKGHSQYPRSVLFDPSVKM